MGRMVSPSAKCHWAVLTSTMRRARIQRTSPWRSWRIAPSNRACTLKDDDWNPAYALHEALFGEVGYLGFGECAGVGFEEGADGAHLLIDDQIVVAQEGILVMIEALDVDVELNADENDEHSHEVGQKESAQLRGADVAAQQFPNK